MAEQSAVIRLEISPGGSVRVLSDTAQGFEQVDRTAREAGNSMTRAFGQVAAAVQNLQQAQARAHQAGAANLAVIQQQIAIQQQVIRGNISQAEGARKLAEAELFAATGSRELAQQLAAARQQFSQNEQAIRNLGTATKTVDTQSAALGLTWGKLQTALVGLGVVFSAQQVLEYADTYRQLEGRLKLVTDSADELTAAQGRLFTVAQSTRQSFEATVATFTRAARAQELLGVSQEGLFQVTEALNLAVRVSGATAVEASTAIYQLSQAFQSGRLQGDEFRSLSESLPNLLDLVAKEMGVTRGALKELGSEGKITSDILARTLINNLDKLRADAEKLPTTVGQAFTVLGNSVLRAVGELDRATGTSAALADAILFVATNVDILVVSLTTLGGTAIVANIGAVSSAIGALSKAVLLLNAAMIANPTWILVAGLTVGVTAAYALIRSLQDTEGETRRLAEANKVARGEFDAHVAAYQASQGVFDAHVAAYQSMTGSLDDLSDSAKAAAAAFEEFQKASAKASETAAKNTAVLQSENEILQNAVAQYHTLAQAQEEINAEKLRAQGVDEEVIAGILELEAANERLRGVLKGREEATKKTTEETLRLSEAQAEARREVETEIAVYERGAGSVRALAAAEKELAIQQLAAKIGSQDLARQLFELQAQAKATALAEDALTKAFEQQVAKSQALDKAILSTQQGYDDSIASINAQREAFDRVIGATGSYEEAMEAAEEASVRLRAEQEAIAAGAGPEVARVLGDQAVAAHQARNSFDSYTQGLKNAASQALLSTRDIETAITGILQGTQNLADVAEDLGQAMGVRLVKGILFGKGQNEQAILGNFNNLLGIGAQGIFASQGQGLGQTLIGSILDPILSVGKNALASAGIDLGSIFGTSAVQAAGTNWQTGFPTVFKTQPSATAQLGQQAGSVFAQAFTVTAIAFMGSQIGKGFADILGLTKSKEASIGAQVAGGLFGGIFGPLGAIIGGLFTHIKTAGSQVRGGVKDFLKDIEVSFAGEIDSGDYFFKETKALANKMFGGDFLAASKEILTTKAGPELARQLQALGTAITADQAIKLGKAVEQTGTTFGTLLLDNLGVDRIPGAIAEIVQKAEINFAGLTDKLTEVFEKQKISAEFYNDTILGAVDIFFGDLPEAIGVSKIALASFTEEGIFSLEEFQASVEEATSTFDLIGQSFANALLNGEDGIAAARLFGEGLQAGLLELAQSRWLKDFIENRLFEGIDLSDGLDSAEIEILKQRTADAKVEFDNLGKSIEGVENDLVSLTDAAKKWGDAIEDAAAKYNLTGTLGPIGTRVTLDPDFLEDAAARAEDLSSDFSNSMFNGIEEAFEKGGRSAALDQVGKNLEQVVFNAILNGMMAVVILPLLQPLISSLAAAGTAYASGIIDAATYQLTVSEILKGTDMEKLRETILFVWETAKETSKLLTGTTVNVSPTSPAGDSVYPPGQDATGFGSGSAVGGGGGGGGAAAQDTTQQSRADEKARRLSELTQQLTEIADRQREVTLGLTEQLVALGALPESQAIAVRIQQITEQLDPLVSRFAAGAKLTADELERAERLTGDLRDAIVDRYQTERDELELTRDAAMSAAESIRGILTEVQGAGATGPEALGQLQVRAAALRQQIAGAAPGDQPALMQQLAQVLQQQVQTAGQIFAPTDQRFLDLKNSIVNELSGLALGAEQLAGDTTSAINELQAATVRELQKLGAQETALLIAQQRILEQQLDALNAISRGRGRGSLASLFGDVFSAQGGLHTETPRGALIRTHPGEYADIWRPGERPSGGGQPVSVVINVPPGAVQIAAGQDPQQAGEAWMRGAFEYAKQHANELVDPLLDSPKGRKLNPSLH